MSGRNAAVHAASSLTSTASISTFSREVIKNGGEEILLLAVAAVASEREIREEEFETASGIHLRT